MGERKSFAQVRFIRCVAAAFAASALGLGGCSVLPASPAPPPVTVTVPAPPPLPVPRPAQKQSSSPLEGNCELNPADMDDRTKVQCGIEPEKQQSSESGTSGDSGGTGEFDNGEPIPYETEYSFEEKCQNGMLTALDGCSSASTPYDDGPGSLYTNPEADPYKRLDESACSDPPGDC